MPWGVPCKSTYVHRVICVVSTHVCHPQLLVVSPLTRTLETASGAFGGGPLHSTHPPSTSKHSTAPSSESSSSEDAASYTSSSSSTEDGALEDSRPVVDTPSLLMHAQAHVPGRRAAHDAITAVPGRSFLALEDVRERMSTHRCDRRQPRSRAAVHFPGVDFSHIATDDDVLWGQRHAQVVGVNPQGGRYGVAEAPAAVAARGVRVLQWLMARYGCLCTTMGLVCVVCWLSHVVAHDDCLSPNLLHYCLFRVCQHPHSTTPVVMHAWAKTHLSPHARPNNRPETSIVVVSHREILITMLRGVAATHSADAELTRALTRGFQHCELRSVEFEASSGRPLRMLPETHYPGGVARLWLFPINYAVQRGRGLMDAARGLLARGNSS